MPDLPQSDAAAQPGSTRKDAAASIAAGRGIAGSGVAGNRTAGGTVHGRSDDLVFVYGALRSGTTVFRLMLDAHPGIANPGEFDFLFDGLHPAPDHPTGWRHDLDRLRSGRIFRSKNLTIPPGRDGVDLIHDLLDQLRARHPGQVLSLNVHRNIGRILAVLPDARVAHMLRDPRDVARSSIAMGWAGTLYHGVGHWIATEAAWDAGTAALPSDRLTTLRYEDLFAAPEARLRDICGFLGVAWDPAMLRYHENTTYAAPDGSLVEQWRRRCAPADLALLEGRAGGLMRARGYLPSGPGRAPGPLHLARLTLRDRAAVWRFGMRRHGTVTFLGEKAARRVRLSGLHETLRRRMARTDEALLK
jgi:hypothetical protein